MNSSDSSKIRFSLRLQICQWSIFACLAILVIGLFQTQVIQGGHYRKVSERNRIRLIRLEAPRGNILDRSGELLATSRPAYDVYAIPEDFSLTHIPVIGKFLGLSEADIREKLSEARYTSFTPVLFKADVSKEIAMQIEERRPELAGVFILISTRRAYPQGEVASHMVGYIGKISRAEYESLDPSVYHFNSWIGRSGIEREFDSRLRGEDGGRQLEVDARGVPIRLLSERKPEPGRDLQLTIDAKLEAGLAPLLGKWKGAILVMDLKTGGILAAVSSPAFDPNIFVSPNQGEERLKVIGSSDKKLLDRSFNGLYPPGSIFKLVTAMAALESGVITPHTTFTCPGYFRLGPGSRVFKCWFPEGHGRVDLYTAIERSCNVYFYNVGRLLGEKRLAAYARKLGFGSSIPMEIPTAKGIVPDREWKKKARGDKWYQGETITLAIGQSYLLVSPLQILRMVAAVATDGKILDPKLVLDASAEKLEETKLGIREETFRALKQGMLQVVTSNRGTGQLARVNFAKLAAKTGTAQAPPGEPHAWFGGFFPFEDPEVALVVFMERGKSGGFAAAQIAKKAAHLYHEIYGSQVS